jgi:hypothetical protein
MQHQDRVIASLPGGRAIVMHYHEVAVIQA